MLGKNRWKKVRKTFLYIHTNIVTKKWGEKKRETIFPETHDYCEQKMLGKKSSEKSEINVLLYSNKYRYEKNGVEKTRETIFPETQE